MPPTNLTELIYIPVRLLQDAVPILVSLALLFFFWGMANFILHAGNTEERKKGRDVMVWGLIALFVILSVAGLVAVLQMSVFGDPGGGV